MNEKMKTLPITVEDKQLIKVAKDTIAKYYKHGKHQIGAALRTKSGKIFTAVNLDANVGRAAVCAEAIVVGKAISEVKTSLTPSLLSDIRTQMSKIGKLG